MSISNLLRDFTIRARQNRGGKRRKNSQAKRGNRKAIKLESLEQRQLLTANLFVDFGIGYMGGQSTNTVGDLIDIVGTNTGPKLTDYGMSRDESVTFKPLDHDFNKDGKKDYADTHKLKNEVIEGLKHVFEPFDVKVHAAATTDITRSKQIGRILGRDNANESGGDVWVIVADAFNSEGKSLVDVISAGGIASRIDFDAGTNDNDEIAYAFVGNAMLAADPVDRLVKVISHEAGHGFGLKHRTGTGTELQMNKGDVMEEAGSGAMFSRFQLQTAAGLKVPYNEMKNNVGLADRDGNGKPDVFYVTGTGAHDEIIVDHFGDDESKALVTVKAYSDHVGGNFLRGFSYSISVLDIKRIRIDAGPGDDDIDIHILEDSFDVTVYAGSGDDIVSSYQPRLIAYGEDGDDTINGEAQKDILIGGAGEDTIKGGEGDDYIDGGREADFLHGEEGEDVLIGGAGNDHLYGGNDTDRLFGGADNDTLEGFDSTIEEGVIDDHEPDALYGGAGTDTIRGGVGPDAIWNLDGDSLPENDAQDKVARPADKISPPAPPKPPRTGFMTANLIGIGGSNSSISATEASAIKDGLTSLVSWATTIDDSLAVGSDAVGDVVGQILQSGLADRVSGYLRFPNPTVDGMLNALAARDLDIGENLNLTVTTLPNSGDKEWEFRIAANRTAEINLNEIDSALPDVTAPVSGAVDFFMSFGIDDGQRFFVKLPNQFAVHSVVDVSDLQSRIPLGLIGGQLSDQASFHASANTTVRIIGGDVNSDFQLSIGELMNAGIEVDVEGNILGTLPFATEIGGLAEHGAMFLENSDLSAAASNLVDIVGSEVVKKFENVNPAMIVQWLSEATNWLADVSNDEVLKTEIPLLDGLTVADTVDFAQAFRSEVLDLLVDENGAPKFSTLQEMIGVLQTSPHAGPSVVSVDFDADSEELLIRFDVDKTVSRDVPLNLDLDLGKIVDLESDTPSPSLSLSTDVGASLVFGINLSDLTSDQQVSASTLLAELNAGTGVQFKEAGIDDLRFIVSDGTSFDVDFANEQTLGEVIATIESASLGTIDVQIDGDCLKIEQAGGGTLRIKGVNGSVAGAGLRIVDESTNGTIVGSSLVGQSLFDRFFVRDALLNAEVSADLSDLEAIARLGIFDLGLTAQDGSINVGVSLALNDFHDGLQNITAAPQLSGSVNLDMGVTLAAAVSDVSLAGAKVTVDWTDITDTSTLSAELTNFADSDAMEAVAMSYVVDGVKHVVNFLKELQQTSVFQTNLPVINRDLADLLDTSERLDELSRELEENPPRTINEAISRIESAIDSVDVSFQGGVLQLDLNLDLAESHQVNLAFDLGDETNLLEEFVDLSATAPLTVAAGVSASLQLGIDTGGPTPDFFLNEQSQLSLEALIQASDVDIDASIGPMGIFIRDGQILLDNGTAGQAATWTMSLDAGNQSGRIGLGQLTDVASLVSTSTSGRLNANLPVHFPTPDTDQGAIELNVTDLADPLGTTSVTTPDFAAAIANLDIDDLLDSILDGWDGVIRLLEFAIDAAGGDLPIIGDQLDDAVGFLSDLRQQVIGKLESADKLTAQQVQQVLFDALGPLGLDVLADRTSDGDTIVNIDDLGISLTQGGSDGIGIDFDFDLAGDFQIGTPIDFDLGLDALGLEVDSQVDLSVDYAMSVGFGVNSSQGFFFATDANPELKVNLNANLKNSTATATLGFLEFTAIDKAADPTHFTAELIVKINEPSGDDRLTLGEIVAATDVSTLVDVRLAGDAAVNLNLAATSNIIDAGFPSIETEFALAWQFDSSDESLAGTISEFGFRDVKIDLSQFTSGLIDPVLSKIKSAVAPLMPLVDALTTRIPVLSDLSGTDVTLIDLAAQFGYIEESTGDFVDAVKNLNNSLSAYSGFVNVGSFLLSGDAARSGDVDDLLASTTATGAIGSASSINRLKDETGFAFPIFDQPTSAIGLLLGRDVALVTYDMPRLEFGFEYSQFFPIVGPLGATFQGEVGVAAELNFGYDTKGLRQFIEGGFKDLSVVANGFFVSDTVNADGSGQDVNEVEFSGAISAYASLNAVVAEVSVGGGLAASLGLNLNDPDDDGKLYWQEVVGQLSQNSLLDVSGKLSAFLRAYAKIGLGPLSKTYEKTFAQVDLIEFDTGDDPDASMVLGVVENGELRLNIGPRAGERTLGNTLDGDEHVVISAGTVADEVVVGFDGVTQSFSGVSKIIGDAGLGDDTIIVQPTVTVPIELRGGGGSDTFVAGGGAAVLFGGVGNDTLTGGTGNDVLNGGSGHDTLNGQGGNDTIHGDDGDDKLYGSIGNDVIHGGGGDDVMTGNGHADRLYGGGGNDWMHAGSGNDQMFGDAGDDTLLGFGGVNRLLGGGGNDEITGGTWFDTIHGEEGNDLIRGGPGPDRIDAGHGDDTVFGEAGIDTLFGRMGADYLDGGADRDYIHGDAGADELLGGAGIDDIYGGLGADILSGGAGNDRMYGNAGDDLMFGFGWLENSDGIKVGNNDVPDGNDRMLGGDGDDLLHGGQGNDLLSGEAGNDVIDGQTGVDRIQYNILSNDPSAIDSLRGGPSRDLVEVMGTNGADDLRVQQTEPGTFLVELRQRDGLDGGQLLASFQFSLPVNASERDIEMLRISGGDGDDLIRALGAINVNQLELNGNAGNDRLESGPGADMLRGGDGNDVLIAGDGRDELHGGSGNDDLDGGDQNDSLFGEAGNDTIDGGLGTDEMHGGSGNDTLRATAGGDLMFGDDAAGVATGDDTLIGSAGNDQMFGGPGVDIMQGFAGDDRLHGGDGDDQMDGGDGDDDLIGDDGNDTINGGTGNDLLIGGDGDDTIDGGAGDDLLIQDSGADVVTAGPTDVVNFVGTTRHDEIVVTQNGNIVRIERSDRFGQLQETSEYTLAGGSLGHLRINGGEGADIIRATGSLSISHVELRGNGGNDQLFGSDGDDVLFGGGGHDVLQGNAGDDSLFGGLHNDTIRGGSGHDLLEGESGDDILVGGTGSDVVDGGLGNDQLYALEIDPNAAADATGTVPDFLIGQSGNDLLIGSPATDKLFAGDGDDLIIHSAGDDVVDAGTDPEVQLTTNNDTERDVYQIRGTESDDSFALVVDDANSKVFVNRNGELIEVSLRGVEVAGISALGGNDDILANTPNAGLLIEVDGGDGNDILDASAFQSSATLRGGNGDDVILGGLENDFLFGDGGNDTLQPGHGLDEVDGGTGNDHLVENVLINAVLTNDDLTNNGSAERRQNIESARLLGSDGDDLINTANFSGPVDLLGLGGDDKLVGGPQADLIDGGDGNDEVTGNGGNDDLRGGAGVDKLIQQANANMFLTNTSLSGVGNDSLAGIESAELIGGAGNNILDATQFTFNVTLNGKAGNDTLRGGSGNDHLIGASGNDFLSGGSGNDTLRGDAGVDRMFGVSGTNHLHGGSGNDEINGGTGTDHAFGDDGDDVIRGNDGNDHLHGGNDQDTIIGGAGTDRMYGELGADRIFGISGTNYVYGGSGNDELTGGTGTDYMYGSFGVDTLKGGAGSDRLYGGHGNDRLEGGSGHDFMYGEDGVDELLGQDGNDRLYGGFKPTASSHGSDRDKDKLVGGSGADMFRQFFFKGNVIIDPISGDKIRAIEFEENITDFNTSIDSTDAIDRDQS